jgi:hypothetical protein
MSADELMRKAQEIKEAAVQLDLKWSENGAAGSTESLFEKYAGLIDPKLEPFTRIPDPKSFDWMVDELSKAVECLSAGAGHDDPLSGKLVLANPKLDKVASAASELASWTGQAADEFKVNFLDPFPSISTNQFFLLVTMRGAIDAHRAACKAAWDDILSISDRTLNSLDNADNCDKNDWTIFLSVTASIAAVGGAAIATDGIALAVLGAASSVGSTVQAIVEEERPVDIGGESAEQIIESMRTAVDTLTAEIRKTEQRITKAVTESTSLVYVKKDRFVSPWPQLAGIPSERITTDTGLGTST